MNKLGFAFILARRGSKGLERKNIRHLGGKPLSEWTLEYLHKSTKRSKKESTPPAKVYTIIPPTVPALCRLGTSDSLAKRAVRN